MMRLDDAQTLFAQSMLGHAEGITNPSAELAGLFTTGAYNLPERLAIYRNNILSSLSNAVLDTYPLVKALTGDDFATGLCHAYVLAHPPRDAYLAHYGAGMDDFIKTFKPADGLPYLAAIATLEWAINESYYAVDDKPLSPGDIVRVSANDFSALRLIPRAAIHLVQSSWPLLAIRDFCLKESDGTNATLNLDQPGGALMVYRSGLSVEILPLEMPEYHCLAQLGEKPLGLALDDTLQTYPDFDFQSFLQKHLSLETFLSPGPNNPS